MKYIEQRKGERDRSSVCSPRALAAAAEFRFPGHQTPSALMLTFLLYKLLFFFIASHLSTAVASVRTHARSLHTPLVYKQTYSYTQI